MKKLSREEAKKEINSATRAYLEADEDYKHKLGLYVPFGPITPGRPVS